MATFYIEAIEDTIIALSKVGNPVVGDASYGINNTSTPTSYIYGNDIVLLAGQKCYWAITNTRDEFSTSNYLNFTSTGKINIGGNLNDLIGGEIAISKIRMYCFYKLFYNCTTLVNASNLTMLVNTYYYCYGSMFEGCTSLTHAPAIQSQTLDSYSCHSMFKGCTSLISVPDIRASVLGLGSCELMFYNCTSLVTAPEILATSVSSSYDTHFCAGMFQGCTSLVIPPSKLSINPLKLYCYQYMFDGCTSLESAPELPATELAYGCYNRMFFRCNSLKKAPQLPATTLTENCYLDMFYACTSLEVAPELPATILAKNCYRDMFCLCSSLVKLPQLPATDLSYELCYSEMFGSCSNIGINNIKTQQYQIPYRIPSSGTGTTITDALKDMFNGTEGYFKYGGVDPEINTTYYVTAPVLIRYKNNVITGLDNGNITLNCKDTKMTDNLIISVDGRYGKRAKVKYDGRELFTITNGNKTLNCKNTKMVDDILIEVEDVNLILNNITLPTSIESINFNYYE